MKSKHLFGSFIIALSLAPSQTWAIRATIGVDEIGLYVFNEAGPVSHSSTAVPPAAIVEVNAPQETVTQPSIPCGSGKYVCAEGYQAELSPVQRVMILYSEVGKTN